MNLSFLTSHARVLLCIARDPGARLRDIAASLGITERSAYGIVGAGYVLKQKDGRRNRTLARHRFRGGTVIGAAWLRLARGMPFGQCRETLGARPGFACGGG